MTGTLETQGTITAPALEIGGDVQLSGRIIPQGFSQTNGIIHTTDMMPAAHHTDARFACAQMGAHICRQEGYERASLGWDDPTDSYAEDHLFWDGPTAWNVVQGCTQVACSVGATLMAGTSNGSWGYAFHDITTCSQRCQRQLPYYCCID